MNKLKLESVKTTSSQMKCVLSNSRFLDDVYDPAIVGYNSVTGAVIYDDETLVNLSMGMFEPAEHPEIQTWGEQLEFCINQINLMFRQECDEVKVDPILLTVFPEDYLSEYIDAQSDGNTENESSTVNDSKLRA